MIHPVAGSRGPQVSSAKMTSRVAGHFCTPCLLIGSILLKTFNSLRYSGSTLTGLIIWVLTMLSLPILGWIMGEETLLRGMSVGVLAQFIAVMVILRQAWGWKRAIVVFAIVAGLAYLVELLGSKTGLLFGKYHYTGMLQPQVAGVPLLIPLAWMMMLPPAWAVAALITRRSGRDFRFIVVSALAFTAWDLFLDPQMVSWGFWQWEVPTQYYGIPLSNYAGWLVVSALLGLIVNPRNLPVGPLALVYTLTWILQTIGQGIFWQQPGPALVGFLCAGFFVAAAIIRDRQSQPVVV